MTTVDVETYLWDTHVPQWVDQFDGSTIVVAPPAAFPKTFGINVAGLTGERGLSGRLSWFDRVPAARIFRTNGNTPLWGADNEASCAPENRMQYSYKPSQTMAQIAAGAIDSQVAAYAAAVPAGWFVAMTLWHEPNGEIGTNFSFADFKAATIHLSQLLFSLPSKDYVVPSPLFSAPKAKGGPAWNNTWMFQFEEMENDNAIWCWDSYGGTTGTATGTYPAVALAIDPGYAQLSSHGWTFEDGHWAIGEMGCSRRDADTNGTVEGQWLTDYAAYCYSRPAKPKWVLTFDGSGVSDFDSPGPIAAWKAVTATSS